MYSHYVRFNINYFDYVTNGCVVSGIFSIMLRFFLKTNDKLKKNAKKKSFFHRKKSLFSIFTKQKLKYFSIPTFFFKIRSQKKQFLPPSPKKIIFYIFPTNLPLKVKFLFNFYLQKIQICFI